jgi:hypothetical protein
MYVLLIVMLAITTYCSVIHGSDVQAAHDGTRH